MLGNSPFPTGCQTACSRQWYGSAGSLAVLGFCPRIGYAEQNLPETLALFRLIGDAAMKRREMLLTRGAAALGLSSFPLGWVGAAEKKKQKLLYFSRSVGYEHSVVGRKGGELSHSEKILTELGKKAGFERFSFAALEKAQSTSLEQ